MVVLIAAAKDWHLGVLRLPPFPGLLPTNALILMPQGSSKTVLQAAAAATAGGDPLASGAGTSAVPAGARVVASAAGGAVAGSGMAGAALGRSLSGQPRKKGVRGVLQRIKGSLHSPR